MTAEELPTGSVSGSGEKKPSKWWYLLPIFLGILGGIAAYLLVKDRDKEFAKRLVIVGIVMTVVWMLVPVISVTILYSIGVFSPVPATSPSSVTGAPCAICFEGEFAYIGHKMEGNEFKLTLQNSPSEKTSMSCTTNLETGCTIDRASSKDISPNSKFTIAANVEGNKNKELTINLKYSKPGSDLTTLKKETIPPEYLK